MEKPQTLFRVKNNSWYLRSNEYICKYTYCNSRYLHFSFWSSGVLRECISTVIFYMSASKNTYIYMNMKRYIFKFHKSSTRIVFCRTRVIPFVYEYSIFVASIAADMNSVPRPVSVFNHVSVSLMQPIFINYHYQVLQKLYAESSYMQLNDALLYY